MKRFMRENIISLLLSNIRIRNGIVFSSPLLAKCFQVLFRHNYYLSHRLSSYRVIDFSRINLIRRSTITNLTDKSYLVHLIDQIGSASSDSGLYVFQHPVEFAEYLLTLSKFSINSYLEIGTAWGGSFIVTVEYLRKLNPHFRYALGCDVSRYWLSMNIYSNRKGISYWIIDTQSDPFKEIVKQFHFDLAFIDGDHSYEGVKTDFQSVQHSSLIAFHDITPPNVGVSQFWDELKDSGRACFEFCHCKNMYGIGLLVNKKEDNPQ